MERKYLAVYSMLWGDKGLQGKEGEISLCPNMIVKKNFRAIERNNGVGYYLVE